MNPRLDELLARIHELETSLAEDLAQQRERLHYRLEGHRASFEDEAARALRAMRRSSWHTLIEAPLLHLVTAPLIYVVIIPLLLLDLTVNLYQWVCFRVYGIPRVRRANYFVYDRGLLPYLNTIERINCLYCSYGSGLIAWARTEQSGVRSNMPGRRHCTNGRHYLPAMAMAWRIGQIWSACANAGTMPQAVGHDGQS